MATKLKLIPGKIYRKMSPNVARLVAQQDRILRRPSHLIHTKAGCLLGKTYDEWNQFDASQRKAA